MSASHYTRSLNLMTVEELNDVINHVVLPPKLPHQDDANPGLVGDHLVCLLYRAVESYVSSQPEKEQGTWRNVADMVAGWGRINSLGDLQEANLDTSLRNLQTHESLVVYMRAQNAALIMDVDDHSNVRFHAFEVSPRAHDVVTTPGRLVRSFPGRSVSCSASLLEDASFRFQLTSTLACLHNEHMEECFRTTRKSGSHHRETRDTVDPAMVTEYLMTTLSAIGKTGAVIPIYKNTRDDVVWSKAEIPWRRSPFWLVLRVTIEHSLRCLFNIADAEMHYKMMMVNVVGILLDLVRQKGLDLDILALCNAKLARRVYKVEKLWGLSPSAEIMKVSEQARLDIESSWTQTKNDATKTIESLPLHEWREATCLTLTRSRHVLQEAMSLELPASEWVRPEPHTQERNAQDASLLPSPDFLRHGSLSP